MMATLVGAIGEKFRPEDLSMTANVKKSWWSRNKGKVLTLSGCAVAGATLLAGKKVIDGLQDQIDTLSERTEQTEWDTGLLFEEVVDISERTMELRDELDVVNDALN